jgi:hypothetical protein
LSTDWPQSIRQSVLLAKTVLHRPCRCRKRVRLHVDPVGAGNSSGHPEQAFRPTRSDPSLGDPSAPSSLQPRRTSGSLKPRILRNSSIPGSTRKTIARGAGRVSDRMIRVDRAVPEIHHTMTAAWAKPQVSGPDEFSAPTPQDHPLPTPPHRRPRQQPRLDLDRRWHWTTTLTDAIDRLQVRLPPPHTVTNPARRPESATNNRG